MRLATDLPLKLSVARGNILVGISGWSYAPWRGNFFPNGLPQKLELAYAARRFGALEVNDTFYSLQRPSTFTSWYNQTPPGSCLPSRADGLSPTCGSWVNRLPHSPTSWA